MAQISKAVAIANHEVAYLAWDIDTTAIPGCLGFHIVREYLDDNDQVTEERPLASYVASRASAIPSGRRKTPASGRSRDSTGATSRSERSEMPQSAVLTTNVSATAFARSAS